MRMSPMEHPIAIPEYALTVLERLERFGYEAYVVGGCVRDCLMGRTPKDWDVCTNALPEEVLRVFRKFHVIKTGLQHGTVTVMVNHEPVEVTTFRVDGDYTDNRHPDSVAFVSRVEEDLSRRDFTINAMAYNPTRGLVDAFGGQEDLKAHLIRCVGDPDARFNEDGLRIMRALRFASRFGFDVERETSDAVRRNRHLLENVSAERIFKELKGILAGEGLVSMLLAYPEVFGVIIPQLAPTVGCEQNTPYHKYDVWTHTAWAAHFAPKDELLRLTLLLHDVAKPECRTTDENGRDHFHGHPERGAEVARRVLLALKSDNDTLRDVVTLVREHDIDLPTERAGMRRLVGRIGLENVQRLFEVQRADLAAHSDYGQQRKGARIRESRAVLEEVLEEEAAFTVKDLHLDGRDLMKMGLRPGPAFRRLLETLLAEVQEERLPNEHEALAARAQVLVSTPNFFS